MSGCVLGSGDILVVTKSDKRQKLLSSQSDILVGKSRQTVRKCGVYTVTSAWKIQNRVKGVWCLRRKRTGE